MASLDSSRFDPLRGRGLGLALGILGWLALPHPARPAALENPQDWWSFQPLRRPAPPVLYPESASWIRNPIDAFIIAALAAQGIPPAPEADRATLIRRLYLDLTGLPPAPETVTSFLRDPDPGAYERWVDHLLASPHFGEQWARHWLDLARYADSDGYEKDSVRPHAWRWRDWVITAINQDMPFDQFTVEQLAGDLLPQATVEQRVATGFHRNTLTNREGGVDQEEYRCKAVVDRVSTTGTVWLGLTLGCAECHSHKYDPISQREFYELYAFFNSADEKDIEAPLPWNLGPGENPPSPPPQAQTLARRPKPRPTHIHERGDFLRPGAGVHPATPRFLHPFEPDPLKTMPDRLDLARWLMDPANPLTSRVAVNRIWQHLFGRGLVSTPDDFGLRGAPPTHPELLTWLACEFIDQGWSRKRLIRLMVTSATYRQSSRHRPELTGQDPLNEGWARQNRFRLTAEMVRDSALSVSGLLTRRVGGSGVRPPLPSDIAALGYANSVQWTESQGEDRYRRGLYVVFQRTVPYPMLVTFDSPDGNVSCTRRERSNTPLQALTLLNDPVFVECAQALACRILEEQDEATDENLVRSAFARAMSREPSARETRRLLEAYQFHWNLLYGDPVRAREVAGAAFGGDACRQAALAAVSRILLNLDEFVTRE